MAGGDRLAELETRVGHKFHRRELLDQALTHASAASPDSRPSFERLEFLGDRVLAPAIATDLLERFADEDEGALARRLSSLVSGKSLVRVAGELGIGEYVRSDSGVADGGVPASVLADSCEAVIGAVYLDAGYETAAAIVVHLWAPLMTAEPPNDAKTELQEWVQARGQSLPVYKTVSTQGPPHAPVFTVRASIDGLDPAMASAGSKRAAERAAAAELLARAKASHG